MLESDWPTPKELQIFRKKENETELPPLSKIGGNYHCQEVSLGQEVSHFLWPTLPSNHNWLLTSGLPGSHLLSRHRPEQLCSLSYLPKAVMQAEAPEENHSGGCASYWDRVASLLDNQPDRVMDHGTRDATAEFEPLQASTATGHPPDLSALKVAAVPESGGPPLGRVQGGTPPPPPVFPWVGDAPAGLKVPEASPSSNALKVASTLPLGSNQQSAGRPKIATRIAYKEGPTPPCGPGEPRTGSPALSRPGNRKPSPQKLKDLFGNDPVLAWLDDLSDEEDDPLVLTEPPVLQPPPVRPSRSSPQPEALLDLGIDELLGIDDDLAKDCSPVIGPSTEETPAQPETTEPSPRRRPSPVRPPPEVRVNVIRIPTEEEPSQPLSQTTGGHIKTVAWMDPATMAQIDADLLVQGQEGTCRRCGLTGTRRRMRIHVRQHHCRFYCACQFTSISRDQAYEHVRRGRRQGNHALTEDSLYMVDRQSYAGFTRHLGWTEPPPFPECQPSRLGDGPLQSYHTSSPSPRPSQETSRRRRRSPEPARTETRTSTWQGYRIPKRARSQSTVSRAVSPVPAPTSRHSTERRVSRSPAPEGRRRWVTTTQPPVTVAERQALTPLERVLETRPPSSYIPERRRAQVHGLERDAEKYEKEAGEVDRWRREQDRSEEQEELLRTEAADLRREASQLRSLADNLRATNRH